MASNLQTNEVLNDEIRELEEHINPIKGLGRDVWINSCRDEMGRLVQFIIDAKGTECISFRQFKDVPKQQKVAYSGMV